MLYVMDNSGPTRLGTYFDDKKVFMRLRSIASTIEREKGRPIQDEDIEAIAESLNVKPVAVQRMLPRIFSNDTTVASTDSVADDEGTSGAIRGLAYIAAEGGQDARDVAMDLSRIFAVMEKEVSERWSGRNHEIILAYLRGEADTDRLTDLAEKHDISVERVRQIWREGREHLRVFLQVHESISSVEDISL
jgi:DNA-directed RNA polymerase sigma subunit (sigma70/sigma32)